MLNKLLILALTLLSLSLYAQEIIDIANPSFEAPTQIGKFGIAPSIDSWSDCGIRSFPSESPFDVQPGSWDVVLPAKDGSSYIGLITRDNETFESIGQILKTSLKKYKEYRLSIYVATSKEHKYNKRKGRSVEFVITDRNPAILRIRVGNRNKSQNEIVYESSPIRNYNWELHEVTFAPAFDADYIVFEVFYSDTSNPSFGNILIDAINLNTPISEKAISDNIESDKVVRRIEKDMQGFSDFQLIDLIMESKECSMKSVLLKPIVYAKDLINNRHDLNTYLETLTPDEVTELRKSLTFINASALANVLSDPIDISSIQQNFDLEHDKMSLYRILIEHMSSNKETIRQEIVTCY